MKLVVLISGSGTTLQNLIATQRRGQLAAEIVGVVSSKADVLGVQRARAAGLPVTIVPRSPPTTFSDRVFAAIEAWQPDWVCLAGWLHLIHIPPRFQHRVLNIHPSLLPAFGGVGMYGRRVHDAVLQSGAKISGCTVHFADDTYDTGPIVLQRAVPVDDADTPESLAERVFAAECDAYPAAINWLATHTWKLQGRRVVSIGPRGLPS
jgi:phosphoribosylglycinamide formyltransferase-1